MYGEHFWVWSWSCLILNTTKQAWRGSMMCVTSVTSMTGWWMTHLFQTGPASLLMTSAPFSNFAWRPPTWPLKVYRQIHGTAMGSPVSVVFANLVMEDVEQEALSTFHTPPRILRRYVRRWHVHSTPLQTGWLPPWPSKQYWPLHTVLDREESDGQLPFLDILLNREEDGSISTSVYRKATHTDHYGCFHSHHPAAHKWAVVRTPMCRAETLSSSGVSRGQEEKLVSQALQGNGYPKGFIHKHTCPQPDHRTPCDQVARGSVTLPYISGLSDSIRRVLAPLTIQVTFRPFRTSRQELVHPKDPVPANRRKGVVYSIPCAECPRTYITG